MYNYVVTDFVVGCIKRVWFFSHRMSMYLMPWMWIFFDRLCGTNIENIYFIIIISWLLNNNRCLVTQLEYFLFKETFMGVERYLMCRFDTDLFCILILLC